MTPMFKRTVDLVEVAGRFRVAKGPRRVRVTADDKVLSDDVTAKHYAVGQPDALGRPIVMGEEFEFIDWKNRKADPRWYIYELKSVDEVLMEQGPLKGQKVSQPRWVKLDPEGGFVSEDDALAAVIEKLGIPPAAAMGAEMVFLADDVLDNGLSQLDTLVDRFDICSQEPANYTEATSTYTLGNKDHGAAGSAFGTPQNGDTSGRKVASTAVTDGSVTGSGTASHWAASDVTNTTLYAANSLSSSQAVTSGNTFSLASFHIEIADPS